MLAADGAGFAGTVSGCIPDRELAHKLVLHAVQVLCALVIDFVYNCLECVQVHAGNWTLVLCDVSFCIDEATELVLVIHPVQVVLAVLGPLDRHVFPAHLPLRNIWLGELVGEWLFRRRIVRRRHVLIARK